MVRILQQRDRLDHDLSEYLDGELGPDRLDGVLERLALDPAAQAGLRSMRRTEELARWALAQQGLLDLEAVVARV